VASGTEQQRGVVVPKLREAMGCSGLPGLGDVAREASALEDGITGQVYIDLPGTKTTNLYLYLIFVHKYLQEPMNTVNL
jgi:hypothetical protein